jgi:hypothetical protein
MTGPTHPVRGAVQIEGEELRFKLLRTHVTSDDARLEIPTTSADITGEIRWRRFKSYDTWTTDRLRREEDNLVAVIPKQPAAGKIIYEISLIDGRGTRHNLTDSPVIIRFKDAVPMLILVLHATLMFAAMLLATRTGLEALAKGSAAVRMTVWTSALLFVGGLILGPIVQKYAFGAFWTGWPLGHDLTDTKTAIAMIFWLIALWRARGLRSGRAWIITAAVVTLLIYLIPHSAYGSELDYTKMGD